MLILQEHVNALNDKVEKKRDVDFENPAHVPEESLKTLGSLA